MDAKEYNRNLDKALLEQGVVDAAMFSEFETAYGYNAATTVTWVSEKLDILRLRLNQGESIVVYEPDKKVQITIVNQKEFRIWTMQHFPLV